MSNSENVITHTYDLLLYVVPQLSKFPRDQKFLLGDRIQTQLMEVLEGLLEAYYLPKGQKKQVLQRVNLRLEKIRYLLRLSKDLQCLSIKAYGISTEKVDGIGRMVGGWIKS